VAAVTAWPYPGVLLADRARTAPSDTRCALCPLGIPPRRARRQVTAAVRVGRRAKITKLPVFQPGTGEQR